MDAVIDTNVLIYDTIENSPFHKRASELIDKLRDPVISSISIVEAGFVLPRYGLEGRQIKEKLDELLSEEWYTISWLSGKLLAEVTTFILENEFSFRNFNDWIIAHEAITRRLSLATFDQDLIRRCKSAGIAVLDF
jgi:hypothetical protein